MPRKSATPKTDGPLISQEDVYEFLLESLSLSREHLGNLVSRGLSEEEVEKFGYKTFPMRRKELVKALEEKFGIDELMRAAVPGLWRNATSGELEIAGKSGIAIPVRNAEGRVTGIKIRVDKPINSSRKYLLLSSNPTPDKKDGSVKYPFGASAKVSVHWPLVKPKKIRRLRITEGELKADIATSLTDVFTISLPGVGMWKLAIDVIKALKPEEVLLAYDSDKEIANSTYDQPGTDGGATEEHVVGKALSSLYLAIKGEAGSLGIKVVGIEHWPAEAGKGIDDVLINGASDQIMVLKDDDADAFAHVMLAEGMPDGWVYVIGVKRFYHMSGGIELDKEQYADRFLHMEKGNPAANALRNPALAKVDFPIYMPNKPVIYEVAGRKFFNTWRKGTLESKPGPIKEFHEHCRYMLPDETERNVLLDWLAFNVQNPGKKILWAVLLQGLSGTGKSYFGWLLRMILGEHNVSMPSNEMIHEIYTAWAKSCQVVVIEEIMARGRLELMNKFKPMITQDTVMIREMQKPAYEQPNVFNMLMFTNHEDAIIIDESDRRYCILFSPAKVRDESYYSEFWDWSKENIAQIAHHFQTRDLSAFKHLGHAPMTAGKKTMIAEGLSPVHAWMKDCIELESWPFMGDLISINHLLSCMPTSIKWVTPQSLAKALKACGAQSLGQYKIADGNVARLWSVRRHEIWAGAEAATLVSEYAKWGNKAEPGGNALLEAKPM